MKAVTKHPAGPDHSVAEVPGIAPTYRREPCGGCPWRKDQTGVFPAEAFRHSANTAEEDSNHTFGCHESGIAKGATCAGFLLRGADLNAAVRTLVAEGHIDPHQVSDGGHELHESYHAMAEANGVERPPLQSESPTVAIAAAV